MRKLLLLTALCCIVSAQVDENLMARLRQRFRPERKAFSVAMMGDHPYGAEGLAKWPALMNSINQDASVSFVVHNGDFKNGSSVCTNAVFQNRLDLFEASVHPFIFTPGDNEWTDCHRENNGSFDPLERLDMLRRMFYPTNQSLGRRKIEMVRQTEDPRFSLYRENAIWAEGAIVFATVHVVGSNNNWGRTPAADAEYTARNLANLYWIRTAFALARDNDFSGVVIIMQADMNFELSRNDFQRLGFNDTIVVLSQEVQAFRKPVLLVNGDTHQLKIDKPLAGLVSNRRLENFTRLQNFSDLDGHWIKVIIDPSDPQLFTLKQMIVPENVFQHR